MDTAFLIVSKVAWWLIRPESWIVIGIAVTTLAAMAGRRRLGGVTGMLTLLSFLAIGSLPLGDLILKPIEETYPPNPPLSDVTGIILLGGAEQPGLSLQTGQPQFNQGGERFVATALLAERFPDARVVFTGGSGALADLGQDVVNAEVSGQMLEMLGVDPARITLEGQSRNTAENAALTHALLEPQDGQTWVLVTSAFHMPRAMQSFAAAGWTGVVPWPVDYRAEPYASAIRWEPQRHLDMLNTALREVVGSLAYRWTGR